MAQIPIDILASLARQIQLVDDGVVMLVVVSQRPDGDYDTSLYGKMSPEECELLLLQVATKDRRKLN
jgi:hypothetical protein